jgi:hypothetical protein
LLQTWLLALAATHAPTAVHLWILDPGDGLLAPLRHLPHVRGYAADGPAMEAAIREVVGLLQVRRKAWEEIRQGRRPAGEEASLGVPALVVAADDYDLLRGVAPEFVTERLEQAVRRDRGLGFSLLLAGSSGTFNQYGYDGLVKAVRELLTGFVLGSHDHADLQLLNLRPPPGEGGKSLPPGQGYYARRGRAQAVKVALPQGRDLPLTRWVADLAVKA